MLLNKIPELRLSGSQNAYGEGSAFSNTGGQSDGPIIYGPGMSVVRGFPSNYFIQGVPLTVRINITNLYVDDCYIDN